MGRSDPPDANAITMEFLATQQHCDALAALALSTSDVDLAVYLQRLLATALPYPEGSVQDEGEARDLPHSPQ